MFVPPIYQALHTSPIALLIRHSVRRDTFPAGEGFLERIHLERVAGDVDPYRLVFDFIVCAIQY